MVRSIKPGLTIGREAVWRAQHRLFVGLQDSQRDRVLETLGARVFGERLNRGLSQSELAERAGLAGRGTVRVLENCHRFPGLRISAGLCDALQISMEELLTFHVTARDQEVRTLVLAMPEWKSRVFRVGK